MGFPAAMFGGNEYAARLLDDLSFVSHVWDDLVDKDKPVAEDDISLAFEKALLSIPNNPFYVEHAPNLRPLIMVGVLGFATANKLERSGDEHQIEIAHGLRYSIAQVGAYAAAVCNTRERADAVLPELWKAMMPERYADYLKEHSHADA